jgi:DNA-binding phage protein
MNSVIKNFKKKPRMAKTKKNKPRIFREFKDFVVEQLQDPEFALAYLKESLKEGDPEKFLSSLKSVVEVHSNDISSIQKIEQLSQKNKKTLIT